MFNTSHKIKYVILTALLSAILISILPTGIAVLKNSEGRADYAANECMDFDPGSINDAVAFGTFGELFGRYAEILRLKNYGGCMCGLKVAATAKYKFGFNQNNIYTPVRIPYYAETCMVLSLIVITFIFMTDGKKRSKYYCTCK